MAAFRPSAVVFDVDGTLLDPQHQLSTATVDAVARLRTGGVLVVIASSRPPAALREIAHRLGHAGDPVIACQGAVQGSFDDSGRFHRVAASSLEPDDAETVTALGRDLGVAANWYVDEHWFVETIDDGVAREARITGVAPTVVGRLDGSLGSPHKVLFTATPGTTDRLVEIRSRAPAGLDTTMPDPLYLDVIAPGVDKWAAVVQTLERHQVPLGGTVAIGDGENDLGMITGAGLGIAMGNASERVRAAADRVTLSNAEDGVAAAIAQLDL